MAKLYPPYLEGTIPAFYKNEDGTATLTVPFSMNKAVNKSSVTGFYARVKTVQSNSLMFPLTAMTNAEFDLDSRNEVTFNIPTQYVNKLNIGQYYKVQLAYDNNGTEGYYSTVGVTKFTTKPTVVIDSLVSNSINMHQYSYTGRYIQATYTYTPIPQMSASLYQKNVYYVINDDATGYILCGDNDYVIGKTYYTKTALNDPLSPTYQDSSEKEYSYQFVIYDANNQVVYDSGILLHNASSDTTPYESSDSYTFPSDLEESTSFYLQYNVITNNNLSASSPKYRIMQKKSIAPEIKAELIAEMNYENGYVDIRLDGLKDEDGDETAATGSFLITRACADDGYKVWHEVLRFVLHGQHPSRWLWRDFTVEQGKRYKYSLQQYNDSKLYSSRIYSKEIEADFEDAFLYDGVRQLKIKYNPKISSFKIDRLETKTDTIGSKYPFIFRNGNVEYKEFPISGLISYQSDEENLFMSDSDLGLLADFSKFTRPATLKEGTTSADADYFLDLLYASGASDNRELFTAANTGALKQAYADQETQKAAIEKGYSRSINMEGYNISAERRFKLAVLEWLNNGEPKLFRSPAEGNYIVRLMNVSLTPEDKLSRMLHSFSATAYEVAEFNYDNLNSFSIISVDEPTSAQLRWSSVPLSTGEDKHEDSRYYTKGDGTAWYAHGELLNHASAKTVRFTDMLPGSLIYFTQKGELQENSIVIGSTGAYLLDTGLEIISVRIPDDAQYQGMFTFSYYNTAQNVFNEISNIEILDVPAKQFIGEKTFQLTRYMTDAEVTELYKAKDVRSINVQDMPTAPGYNRVTFYTNNVVRYINNVRDSLLNFLYLKFRKRSIGNCYEANGTFYRDRGLQNEISAIPTYCSMLDDDRFNTQELLTPVYDGNGVITKYILSRDKISYNLSAETMARMLAERYFADPFMLYRYTRHYPEGDVILYHDPTNPGKIIVDPASEQIYAAAVKNSNYEVYSNFISIDGHPLDLSQIGQYIVEHPYSFDLIEIDNGIVLDCGYQLQRIHYSLEQINSTVAYALAQVLEKDEILSQAYKQAICTGEDDSQDEVYVILAAAALKDYNDKMESFLDLLGQTKAEWEANENL